MSVVSKEARTFVEIARCGSVRKAAERLNISASALSRQVRILENDIGVKLLTRHSNGVQMTEFGEQFLSRVQELIDLESTMRGEIRAASGTQQLRIRLGLSESISTRLAQRLRSHLENTGISVRLDILVGETERLAKRLAQGQLDAVVAYNLPANEHFRVVDVFEVQVGLVCAHDLFADPPDSISLAECLAWPLCLPGEELSIHPRLLTEIHRQGRAFKIAATSNSMATTCSQIAEGAGVGFMTLPDVIAHPEREKLLFIPLNDRRLKESIVAACASHVSLPSDLGKTLKIIRRIAAELIQDRPSEYRLPGRNH